MSPHLLFLSLPCSLLQSLPHPLCLSALVHPRVPGWSRINIWDAQRVKVEYVMIHTQRRNKFSSLALFCIDHLLLLLLLATVKAAYYHTIRAWFQKKMNGRIQAAVLVSSVSTSRHPSAGAQTFHFFKFVLEFTKEHERGREGHRVDRTGHRVHVHEVH